jgi:hypothetical protein
MTTQPLSKLEASLVEIVKVSGRGWALEQIYQRCDYADNKTDCASALHRLVTYGLLVRNGSGHYYLAGHNVVEMQPAKTAAAKVNVNATPLQPKVKPTKADQMTPHDDASDELASIELIYKDGRRVAVSVLNINFTTWSARR